MVRMSCLVCGQRWETEAVLDNDSAYVILDDLCPKCEAQGELVDLLATCQGDHHLYEWLGGERFWVDIGD